MRAVVLHEYGGPEKLKFEDNVPEPQISGSTVLIAAAAASVNPIGRPACTPCGKSAKGTGCTD